MDNYIIVRTFCDKAEVASKIIKSLLDKKLVSGSQMSKIHSEYWWDGKIEECDEFKIEFRSKESLFKDIEEEILKIHDYETAEVSYIKIDGSNKDFYNWIDENIKK